VLPGDDKAMLAAEASEAAAAQGKFWEMHDQLFTHQPEWLSLTPDQFRAKLNDYIKIVGISDIGAFNAALDQHKYVPIITKATQEANDLDLKGVPVLLFNGLPYSGRIDEFALTNYVNLRLLEKRWYKHPPDFKIDTKKQYTATLVTEKGNVVIELYTQAAPVTVNNFIFLAKDGWYNNITFHRVIPDQLAQTGDPSGSGFGTAGYSIIDEADNGLGFDREGMVAMASQRNQPNTASSQFFITYGPLRPALDYDKVFTIFGHVTSGMDVMRKLTPRDPFDQLRFPNPPPGDKLIRVDITESN
jgi:cyclophilin family peptidyl-prolyl cis-trans isomerase